MKIRLIALLLVLAPFGMKAQTETTRQLLFDNDNKGIFTIYFYKNTLKMLNQTDSKEFDEMIKGIEKLRFLLIDKAQLGFGAKEYKDLVKKYASESYEQMLTSRMDGRNFDVYMKNQKGSPLGTIILVNDSSKLYIMDMIGTIDITKAPKVFSEIDKNSDVSNKISNFLNHDKKDGGREHKSKVD